MSQFSYEVTDVAASPGLTPSQTVGPFFHDALPYEHGPRVAGHSRAGTLRLRGRVLDGEGVPIPDSLVEIWQADEHGELVQEPGIYDPVSPDGFRGFGRCPTDTDGCYEFVTVKPAAVPTVDGATQAPHIAMSVFARGMLRRVVTRVYFADEADRNATDPLLSSVEQSRRGTLIATAAEDGYRFDVHIQGDHETVFLDVFTR
ncbi:MAG TPA: protocatechuate 3,4-dioxygenase subunit alpha [Nocardioidaceae bacterium]|nr:protocatechuate 3,4-dioxygenase subunit alpha [Nocardioidaceae bacterium]